MTREIYRGKFNNMDCIIIADKDGNIERAYPIEIRQAKKLGYCDTMEVSTEILLDLALMQNRGVKLKFKP